MLSRIATWSSSRALVAVPAAIIPIALGSTVAADTIYVASSNGGLFAVDVDYPGLGVNALRGAGYGAFSIAHGDTADSLFVLIGSSIERFDLTQSTSTPTGVTIPHGLAFSEGPDGFWYITDSAGPTIRRFLPGDNSFIPQALTGGTRAYAGDLATSPGGQMFGATADGAIVLVDPDTGAQSPWADPARTVYGLAFTADGRMFAGDGNGSVFQVDTTAGGFTLLGNLGFGIFDMASGAPVPAPGAAALILAFIPRGRRRRPLP
jgi:hypothetical protein